MPTLPTLDSVSTTKSTTDVFSGYVHKLKLEDGQLYDTENLSTQYYPLLSSRNKRGTVKEFTNFQGICDLNDKLGYVDDGTLYYDGEVTPITGLSSGKKQLVTTGAYICVFPDGKYYNTAKPTDYGAMADSLSLQNLSLEYRMCNAEGVEYDTATKSDTAPENPEDGDLWIDTKYKVLKQWSEALAYWVDIANVYTKIIFPALPSGSRPTDHFAQYDGVTISGLSDEAEGLNGSKILQVVADTYIVLIGILDNTFTQTGANIKIDRTVPDMDYVIECQNRLWGCKYGTTSTGTINEIYCCALGDFKNWNQFQGISTDSYAVSVGSDGPFTGAINYLGYPTFFKADFIHRVSVASDGGHSILDTPCRGLQQGSEESLVLVNETLYFKSVDGVCAYQGGFPSKISDAFGDMKYFGAVAGSIGDNYYISMKTSNGRWNLFVADTERGLWVREDNLHVTEFCRSGDELYAVADNKLIAMLGSVGELEDTIDWVAETGMLYYEYTEKKYISRFNIRMTMETGSYLKIYIEYDSDGTWVECGDVFLFNGTGTVTIPVRPRRCDHMRLKIAGHGPCRIFSIARILRTGSDM